MGRRLSDTAEGEFPLPYDELQEGDAWKVLDRETGEPLVVDDQPSNLTRTAWMVHAPGRLLANLRAHTVREHEDGSISVRPGDGSSNSILVQRRPEESWRGYIEHNEWTPA
jgi:hypothetical protein